MSSALIIKGMAKLRGFWRESWVCLGLKVRLTEVEYPAYMSFAKDLLSNHWFCFQIRGDFGNIFGNNRQFARFVSKLDLFLETFLETSVAAPPSQNPSDGNSDKNSQKCHQFRHFHLKETILVTISTKIVTIFVTLSCGVLSKTRVTQKMTQNAKIVTHPVILTSK